MYKIFINCFLLVPVAPIDHSREGEAQEMAGAEQPEQKAESLPALPASLQVQQGQRQARSVLPVPLPDRE